MSIPPPFLRRLSSYIKTQNLSSITLEHMASFTRTPPKKGKKISAVFTGFLFYILTFTKTFYVNNSSRSVFFRRFCGRDKNISSWRKIQKIFCLKLDFNRFIFYLVSFLEFINWEVRKCSPKGSHQKKEYQ